MERNTRQRQAVLEAIDHAGRALTPNEILGLAQTSVASLNLSTIYRHLNALQDEQRIVKVLLPGQAAARFEAVCSGEHAAHGARGTARHGQQHGLAHHHHHFHCNRCDRVYPLHACPGSMQELAPQGFLVEAHEITLTGVCAECRRVSSKAKARATAT
ncbi:MAG TPA: transcriptional repressor [Burkholderiaceae bacterium]